MRSVSEPPAANSDPMAQGDCVLLKHNGKQSSMRLEAFVPEDSSMTRFCATCVEFTASDVLVIGMTGVHAKSCEKAAILCGIRLYNASEELMTHVLFMEILGEGSIYGLCIGVLSNPLSYLLFMMEDCIGVFAWKERYSDRLVCVASVPGAQRLTAGAFLWSEGFGCVADDAGSMYLLDIRGCLRGIGDVMQASFHVRSRQGILPKSRCLESVKCVRGGAFLQENPMTQIQVVGSRKQPEIRNGLLWRWKMARYKFSNAKHSHLRSFVSRYVDDFNVTLSDSAQEYPSPTFSTNKLHFVSPAKVLEHQILFFTIFGKNVREWKFAICAQPRVDLVLPCVKDVLELPVIAIGAEVVAVAWSLENRREEDANGSHFDDTEWYGCGYAWLVTASGKLEHFVLKREESESDVSNQKNDLILRIPRTTISEDEHCDNNCERNETIERAEMTIQERYRLPEMRLSDMEAFGEKITTQLTRMELDSRLECAAARVDRLHRNLESLRGSFQRFCVDVQQQMNDLTRIVPCSNFDSKLYNAEHGTSLIHAKMDDELEDDVLTPFHKPSESPPTLLNVPQDAPLSLNVLNQTASLQDDIASETDEQLGGGTSFISELKSFEELNPQDDEDDEEEEEVAILLSNSNKAKPTLRFTGGFNRYIRNTFTGLPQHNSADQSSQDYGENESFDDAMVFGARRTAFDVDIDMLEEKPWRKPGIDIADYFNYGFDERGWREYAANQLKVRREIALEKAKEQAARQASTAAVAHANANAERASKASQEDGKSTGNQANNPPGADVGSDAPMNQANEWMGGAPNNAYGREGNGMHPGMNTFMQPPRDWHPNMGPPPHFMPNWMHNGPPRDWGGPMPPPWMSGSNTQDNEDDRGNRGSRESFHDRKENPHGRRNNRENKRRGTRDDTSGDTEFRFRKDRPKERSSVDIRRDRSRQRGRAKDKDEPSEGARSRTRDRPEGKSRERSRERNRDRVRNRDRDRDRYRNDRSHERDRGRDRGRDREKFPPHDRDSPENRLIYPQKVVIISKMEHWTGDIVELSNLLHENFEDSDPSDGITPSTLVHSHSKESHGPTLYQDNVRIECDRPIGQIVIQDPKAIWLPDEVPSDDEDDDSIDIRTRPVFEILYKQNVMTEDVFLGLSDKDPSSAQCEAMLVRIFCPNHRIEQIELEVKTQKLLMSSSTLKLVLGLPYPVRYQDGKAAWDAERCVVAVSLPIIRAECDSDAAITMETKETAKETCGMRINVDFRRHKATCINIYPFIPDV
uniref:Uncharacterized protein AlNc14C287G10193 n=1 Tax=Albugo laibachii Nc14 TaxID=890382 RepID=F0WV49_9STRA|nr:conserved hypothetical protein [Albugo laibachii Nc14]|eukprot:CCA25287.1 conserved hypothetical protein [Albugo laibachii Nc14]